MYPFGFTRFACGLVILCQMLVAGHVRLKHQINSC